jgi:hypothetical protein
VSDETKPDEGWEATIYERRKFHYLRGGVSLCGRFMRLVAELTPHVAGRPHSNEECTGCWRRIDAERYR